MGAGASNRGALDSRDCQGAKLAAADCAGAKRPSKGPKAKAAKTKAKRSDRPKNIDKVQSERLTEAARRLALKWSANRLDVPSPR